jgi:hypothetical protein
VKAVVGKPKWAATSDASDLPAVQIGHRTSKHTKAKSHFALEDADVNQATGRGPERGGGYTVKETVLIKDVPVDLESALRWSGPETSKLTKLRHHQVLTAPRTEGWPAPSGITDKSAMQRFSREMLRRISDDPKHPLRFLLKSSWKE